MATYQKTFECLTCQASIKLERDQANNKWLRYNLDGSEHKCAKKNSQPQQQQVQQQTKFDESQLASLEKKIGSLEAYIRSLVSQVQQLRGEINNKELKK